METPPIQGQWPEIKEIVGAALEREPGERQAYLDEACSESLRREVDSLIAAYEEAAVLSQHPLQTEDIEFAIPAVIGPYHLVRELGVGGMGRVWLAEQKALVRRLVAVKLIKAGMYDGAILQRFLSERQSLALMDHPSIAKVYDAGTTEHGQPYLVMEYVDGLPITEYCDSKKLSNRARLDLFVQVCEGVQHAHQKAIIHRDLKPSNILIAEVDGKPRPRLIDFGLAKATSPFVPGGALLTQVGVFLGTPAYMSPEQADPIALDIDTRTDVYSLGVILYELLCGSLPFDLKRGLNQPFDEYLRQFREEEAMRPSARVSAKREDSAARAEARSTDPASLTRSLRGDLDWINLKALEKDRARRYGTPSELAADIDNYLHVRPVKARPASTGYRVRKYVQRNRVAAAGAFILIILLTAFAVTQAVQLRRITRERDRAARERDRADRVTAFMTNMFEVSEPSESRGNSITAREILDKSAVSIHSELKHDPELQAQMLHVMGTVYQKLGLYSEAEPLLKEAIAIRSRVLGGENIQTLVSKESYGILLFQLGRVGEAERFDRDLLNSENHSLGIQNRETLATMSDLFWALNAEGHLSEAASLGRSTVAAQQEVLGMKDHDTLVSMARLSLALNDLNQDAEAEALARQTIDLDKQVFGVDDPQTLLVESHLGLILVWEGHPEEAEKFLRPTLAAQSHVLGSAHQNTVATMNTLGIALQHQKKYSEAEELYRRGYEASLKTLGPDHRGTLMMQGNLATVFQDRGEFKKAESLTREILAARRRILGVDNPETALAMSNLADALHKEGRNRESGALFREAADVQSRVLGPGHSDTLDTWYNLACVLAVSNQQEEAIDILSKAAGLGLKAHSANFDMETDPDLKSLHRDPRFADLVAIARKNTASARQLQP